MCSRDERVTRITSCLKSAKLMSGWRRTSTWAPLQRARQAACLARE